MAVRKELSFLLPFWHLLFCKMASRLACKLGCHLSYLLFSPLSFPLFSLPFSLLLVDLLVLEDQPLVDQLA